MPQKDGYLVHKISYRKAISLFTGKTCINSLHTEDETGISWRISVTKDTAERIKSTSTTAGCTYESNTYLTYATNPELTSYRNQLTGMDRERYHILVSYFPNKLAQAKDNGHYSANFYEAPTVPTVGISN